MTHRHDSGSGAEVDRPLPGALADQEEETSRSTFLSHNVGGLSRGALVGCLVSLVKELLAQEQKGGEPHGQ